MRVVLTSTTGRVYHERELPASRAPSVIHWRGSVFALWGRDLQENDGALIYRVADQLTLEDER